MTARDVRIGEVTYPAPGLAQVIVDFRAPLHNVPLATAVEMFTALAGVKSAGSLRWHEGKIALYLQNPHVPCVSREQNEDLELACTQLLLLENSNTARQ